MQDENAMKETAEATSSDDGIVEVDSNAVLKLMRQQAEHIDRQDDRIAELENRNTRQNELLLGMQREISLLASAISGHQQIIEASQPEPKTGPPPPPTIMH
jgi:hypothetical protein